MHTSMTKIISLKTLLFLCILYSLSGCATREGTLQTYSGPQLASSETAFLKPPQKSSIFGSTIEIEYVDGLQVKPYLNAEILPGEHTATIMFYTSQGNYHMEIPAILNFVAERGRSYIAHAKYKRFLFKRSTWFWIEDEQTGKVVGGERPD